MDYAIVFCWEGAWAGFLWRHNTFSGTIAGPVVSLSFGFPAWTQIVSAHVGHYDAGENTSGLFPQERITKNFEGSHYRELARPQEHVHVSSIKDGLGSEGVPSLNGPALAGGEVATGEGDRETRTHTHCVVFAIMESHELCIS